MSVPKKRTRIATPAYARALYGIAAIVAGIVTILWHDSEVRQHLHALPAQEESAIAGVAALIQIVAGLALLLRRSVRLSALAIGALYLLLAFGTIPGMVAAPRDYGSYVDVFELLAIVCGALALYVVEGGGAKNRRLGWIARVGLGVCSISFALAQIVYLKYTASLVPSWIPPGQVFWTNLTTVAFGAAALAMLSGVRARLAMRLMGLMVVLFGLIVWVPIIAGKPGDLSNWSEIAENYLIAAAAFLVAELRAW